MPIPISSGDLASEPGVRREPMSDAGASGARLERLHLPDGSTLVRKAFAATDDWTMRATHDPGRAATLWTSGVMDRLPPTIDPAIVRIERAAGHSGSPAWVLYLRDVADHFLRRGTIIDAREARRVLEAFASMHAAFRGDGPPSPDLCRLEDLLLLAAPSTVEREAGAHPFLDVLRSGWVAFDELAPPDVAGAIHAVLADPAPLATALRAADATLVHADPHYGNIAPAADRFYVIDWGLAAWAPAAVDFAWWLDQSASFLAPGRDDLLAAFRSAEGPGHSEVALELALLAEVALAGWQALDVVNAPDAETRASRLANLDWWAARARIGLERLG